MVAVAQLVRASHCGCEGCAFESRRPPIYNMHRIGFLNKKIPTIIGLTVVLLVGIFASWLIINGFQKFIEIRFRAINAISEN